MTEALATVPAAVEYSPQQKELMMSTVAKGCKPEQFYLMMELAKKYRLDPFAKQIWATPMGVIIGRDGWLAIAHGTGKFDGMSTEFSYDKNGKLMSSTTTVWRKDMSHPFVETARMSNFDKGTQVWKQFDHEMIQKCSERKALSKAFCITGLYSDAELCDNPAEPEEDISCVSCIDAEIVDHTSHDERPAADPQPDKCTKCGCALMPAEEQRTVCESFRKLGYTDGVEEFVSGLCKKCAAEAWREAKSKTQCKPPAVPTKNPGTPAKPEPAPTQREL